MKIRHDFLNQENSDSISTIVLCIKLQLKNGTEMGFTTHDKDLTIENVLYIKYHSLSQSTIINNSNLAPDSLDIKGVISSDLITAQDIIAGLYDNAEILIFMVDYKNPNIEKLQLRKGWLGEIKIDNNQFFAEVRGLSQIFSNAVGETYSTLCRAQLGDSRCNAKIKEHIVECKITKIYNQSTFSYNTSTPLSLHYYQCGHILFSSQNIHRKNSAEIKVIDRDKIELYLQIPNNILSGESFLLYPGCDKTLETCCTKYNNAINYRGEPHIQNLKSIADYIG